MKYADCVEILRANSYAPAPIVRGQEKPPGPWSVVQRAYSADEHAESLAAVLAAIPPAHDAGSPVQDAAGTRLTVVRLTVRTELAEDVDAFMGECGGHVVRVAQDGARLYVFRNDGMHFSTLTTPEYYAGSARVSSAADFVALAEDATGAAFDWPRGSLLDVRRDELAELNVEAAHRFVAEFTTWADAHPEPQAPYVPYVAPPILAPGQRLTFDNARARLTMKRAGFHAVQTSGGGVGLAMNPVGDHYEDRLVTVSIESRSAEIADVMLAKFGVKDRTGEILPKLAALIRKRGDIPCRREANGSLLFLLQNSSSSTFEPIERMFSAQGPNGKEIPGTSVRVRVESRGVVDLTGDGVPTDRFKWDADFLGIKREQLPELSEFSTKNYLLEEIASLMAAGGGLDAAPGDAAAKGKGSRKSAAATA
ncbi:MAG: hypothetical protein ABI769_18070 [Pseudomonadota bacterium]